MRRRTIVFAGVLAAGAIAQLAAQVPKPTAADLRSASTQNLAASFLGNKNRLDMLAMFERGDMKNANLLLGTTQVTPANVQQLKGDYRQNQDLYTAELQRRGPVPVAGKYQLGDAPSCASKDSEKIDVVLKQDGFVVEVLGGSPEQHMLSGVAVAKTLTLGDGDFDPNSYLFGPIGADGNISMKPFVGGDCPIVLTKKPAK